MLPAHPDLLRQSTHGDWSNVAQHNRGSTIGDRIAFASHPVLFPLHRYQKSVQQFGHFQAVLEAPVRKSIHYVIEDPAGNPQPVHRADIASSPEALRANRIRQLPFHGDKGKRVGPIEILRVSVLGPVAVLKNHHLALYHIETVSVEALQDAATFQGSLKHPLPAPVATVIPPAIR
ncbi:hypothetical protein QEH56_14580 [Pelagicoccus enzymogenes]|uniref:hypothetical protein n=1 Tax=Pelagicoccus enzymogenes TaxID=2773457 RepID=UPI00280DD9BB|nr:hypothetical protein [Pelagicoccus enzymogenes]MDQ8199389.1 hypothetical protein [Pelagicoccus enzymogenes]